jgi:hypothetical protein
MLVRERDLVQRIGLKIDLANRQVTGHPQYASMFRNSSAGDMPVSWDMNPMSASRLAFNRRPVHGLSRNRVSVRV